MTTTVKLSAVLAFAGMLFSIGLATPVFSEPAASEGQSYGINVPAQFLGDALTELGRQTGKQISVNSDLLKGLKADALSGEMTVEAALDALLQGTGLQYEFSGEDTVVIMAPKRSNHGAGVIQLDDL
ncbi:MAG: STN domain-containing protein, partial [Verrucomicrobiota bacterium]